MERVQKKMSIHKKRRMHIPWHILQNQENMF